MIDLPAIQRWAAGIAESQGTASGEEERVAHAIRAASTTFPVEQGTPAFKSENDLPSLSPTQSLALACIKRRGGTYHQAVSGKWHSRDGPDLALPDRTILSLIRAGYLTVTAELEGKPVQVTLTFP